MRSCCPRWHADAAYPEQGHRFLERFRLHFERLRRCSHFFDERSVLLRAYVHLCNGMVDLFDAGSLLRRRAEISLMKKAADSGLS